MKVCYLFKKINPKRGDTLKIISQHSKKLFGRKKKRSLAHEMGKFLSKQGLVKPSNKISLNQKRKKKANGTEFFLRTLFTVLFWISSIYALEKTSPIPKTVLGKFNVKRFSPKSTFYREICNLNLESLQKVTDKLIQRIVKAQKEIIVTLDGHPIDPWSKNYDQSCWGASSCGSFHGYKLFASILHGTDIIMQHLLSPANHVELDFAKWQINQLLQKLPRIDVLVMDRGYFCFEFFAFLIQKHIGFITVAKQNTAAIQPYLRNIASCIFHDINEKTEYHETLLWFPDLRKKLRVIFVRKFIKGEIKEYELITNLPQEYSAAKIINLYSKRQGREDVFDRLKNELGLHKPCKIVDFEGVKAFVALTITSYNVYSHFSHSTLGAYVTIQVMHGWFLQGKIEEIIANRKAELIIEETMQENENKKTEKWNALFHINLS